MAARQDTAGGSDASLSPSKEGVFCVYEETFRRDGTGEASIEGWHTLRTAALAAAHEDARRYASRLMEGQAFDAVTGWRIDVLEVTGDRDAVESAIEDVGPDEAEGVSPVLHLEGDAEGS